jgi:sialic acid synthase SpsE/mannose-6-phosphate isomerase-like protein (cupin superfamily)
MIENIFENLFIFEMANNHMGDVSHGVEIIRKFHETVKPFNFKFAFKYQYRDLNSFIHPDFKNRMDIKYVKRFSETHLSEDEFLKMKQEADKLGFISVCTPFDEKSVDLVVKHDYSVIKIASCSFTDWPLLEKIAQTDKPLIASTAGASLEEIDRVVSFFQHRSKKLCLMHCVGSYPTRDEELEINQIDLFKERYSNISVGFSTHETPDNTDSIKIAIAKGAQVFERHVALPTEKYSINAYSSTPEQIFNWLDSAKATLAMCGVKDERRKISEKEESDLRGLKRGVYATEIIDKDSPITETKTFYAIPNEDGQILANDISKYNEYIAKEDIAKSQAILSCNVDVKNKREKVLVIIKKLSALLKESGLRLSNELDLELSHHYGIDQFERWGCSIINCINREYCKKIIILLPGQENPCHAHKKKEETFHILYGTMQIKLGEETKTYQAGEMVTVERNVKHSFSSDSGAIFEEVSTTHYKDDSFYEDEKITDNTSRKTQMTFWADWLNNAIS